MPAASLHLSPGRKVVAPSFGRQLTSLRGTRNRGGICRGVMAIGGIRFDRSTLLQYERGTVGAPDPVAVYALAEIYGVAVADLIRCLVADRAHRPAASLQVNTERRRLLDAFDRLTDEERHSILVLVERNRVVRRQSPLPSSVAKKAPSRAASAARRLRRA